MLFDEGLCNHYHACPVSCYFQGQELKGSTVCVWECVHFMAMEIHFCLQYQSHTQHTLNKNVCLSAQFYIELLSE